MFHKMKIVWIIFFITLLTSDIHCKLSYAITQWNYCPTDEISLKTIIGINLQQCIAECGRRESCGYICYFRYISFCKLYKGSDSTPLLYETNRCLYIKKEEIDDSGVSNACQCDEYHVCRDGTCEFEECQQISLRNGHIFGNKNEIGSKKYFNCDVGFIETSGNTTTTCTSGNWSYYPTCFLTITCSNLTITNGELIGNGNEVGAIRTIECHYGYKEIYNETSIQCEGTGIWNYIPTCIQIIVCTDVTIANGSLIGTGNEVGAVRTIDCHPGYKEISDETTIQCDSTGQWNYFPACSPIITCTDLTIANGDLIGTGNEVGAVRTITCHYGYKETSDETSIQCDNTGLWSYIPVCDPVIICSSPFGHSKDGFRIKVFNDDREDHDEAHEECINDNGTLAVIDEAWKMEFVNEVLGSCQEYNKHDDYWTDGRPKNNKWKFNDNNLVPMTKNVFWYNGEPDSNDDDKCARLERENGRYLWDDKDCEDNLRYICEY